MSVATKMLRTTPADTGYQLEELAQCIEACFDSSQAATACADACLAEPDARDQLVRCITLDLNCADVCEATGRILSRQAAYDGEVTRATLIACRTASQVCADECERHAHMHEHCRTCAEACRRCEEACIRLLAA